MHWRNNFQHGKPNCGCSILENGVHKTFILMARIFVEFSCITGKAFISNHHVLREKKKRRIESLQESHVWPWFTRIWFKGSGEVQSWDSVGKNQFISSAQGSFSTLHSPLLRAVYLNIFRRPLKFKRTRKGDRISVTQDFLPHQNKIVFWKIRIIEMLCLHNFPSKITKIIFPFITFSSKLIQIYEFAITYIHVYS